MKELFIKIYTTLPGRLVQLSQPLLEAPLRRVLSVLLTLKPDILAGLTAREATKFTTDPPVDLDTPLGSILQENTLCITVESAQAGIATMQTLEDRLTRLENELAVQMHLTRGLHLICIRTFLDAHLLEHGYNNSYHRPTFLERNQGTITNVLGLDPDTPLQGLFRTVFQAGGMAAHTTTSLAIATAIIQEAAISPSERQLLKIAFSHTFGQTVEDEIRRVRATYWVVNATFLHRNSRFSEHPW